MYIYIYTSKLFVDGKDFPSCVSFPQSIAVDIL